MFHRFPLFWYFRQPRRLAAGDRIRNTAFVLNGHVFAGMQWRAPCD